jgi:zinc transport system substrate-binding protein
VSILPQAYFVERIAGDLVDVNVMVGPGEEPHTFEPKPEQMKALNNSLAFFSIGIEYEDNWIPKFSDVNPDLLIVDSTAGIQRIEMLTGHSHEEESEVMEEDHDHDHNMDPHVWLSPANGKIIAENIFLTLADLLPVHKQTFNENFQALISDIDALDAAITQSLDSIEQRTFMVFHPAWGYFAAQYNLEQVAVQVGGQDPSPVELSELVKLARKEGIRFIFIQPTFSANSVEALSVEIGAEIALVDPLARNWLENLENVAQAFSAALKKSE